MTIEILLLHIGISSVVIKVRREAEIAFTTSLVCAAPNKWMPILVAKPHIMQQQIG